MRSVVYQTKFNARKDRFRTVEGGAVRVDEGNNGIMVRLTHIVFPRFGVLHRFSNLIGHTPLL